MTSRPARSGEPTDSQGCGDSVQFSKTTCDSGPLSADHFSNRRPVGIARTRRDLHPMPHQSGNSHCVFHRGRRRLPRNADERLACRGDFSDPYPICQSEYRRVLEEVSENSAGNAAPPENARRDVRSESGKGWKTGAKTFGWLVAVFLLSSAQDGGHWPERC